MVDIEEPVPLPGVDFIDPFLLSSDTLLFLESSGGASIPAYSDLGVYRVFLGAFIRLEVSVS